MGDKTKIEWTDASWTPIRARNKATGQVGWFCEHASDGCRNCYAESMNARLGTQLPFKPGHRRDVEIFVDEKTLAQPRAWRRRRKIFVCSMTDLFGDFVPTDAINQVFGTMAACPQHTFQILTKRPDRMRDYFHASRGFAEMNGAPWPLPNVWLGTSVEDQRAADLRIPQLLQTPAALHFLSCEPLLGPVDLTSIPGIGAHVWRYDALRGENWVIVDGERCAGFPRGKIGWVIAGGESGPHARPMHPAWVRSLRDQCAAAGTPFHFKQWGEQVPAELIGDARIEPWRRSQDGREFWAIEDLGKLRTQTAPVTFHRVGKKQAGRQLDGVEHNGIPAL